MGREVVTALGSQSDLLGSRSTSEILGKSVHVSLCKGEHRNPLQVALGTTEGNKKPEQKRKDQALWGAATDILVCGHL